MKIPSPVKCVIFDMDGVIINSEEIHKKAYYETFNSLNVIVSDTLYKSFTGSSTSNAFQRLIAHFNLDEDPEKLVLDKRERYLGFFENDPNLQLVYGAKEIIQYLHAKGITLVLASSSAMVNIDRVFNRFHLQQYFTAKISGADLIASKPHPEIFNKAVILSNFKKENCIVIEDSDNGIKAANDAQIFVFGYANKLSEGQTLENANLVIDNFNALKEFV
ncbi:predicted phosphatase/phosphohexomutase [Polaribacter irgensii 23-P]|uniref:Predicted phosphatase/phosphohexomutase n=1 Tax=Polaribacter irgensii 23-P TaxID=313594 RepID=A4C1C6_9FLAO|nr:HAD family phosphatase [Polaribacter irgensii]EAR11929.1 predicted phosphatase/phosphohexomutase [Polaribacter irgensii 23-P]